MLSRLGPAPVRSARLRPLSIAFSIALLITGRMAPAHAAPFAGQPGAAGATVSVSAPGGQATAPGPRFVSGDDRGLSFRHQHGGSGSFYIVESIGPGAGFIDYDADGWIDAYLIQGAPLPRQTDGAPSDPAAGAGNVMFRNRHGLFDRAAAAGVADSGYGMGVAAGDFDNDGWADLYVTNWGPNALYRNNGDGTFARRSAGVEDDGWGTSATWVDVDNDADLDLFVVNYLSWGLDDHRPCHYGADAIESYCGPELYDGAADLLFENNGDGTFTDVSSAAGIVNRDDGKGLGVVAADYDADGDIDLYVANDTRPNFLWVNDGSGKFVDDALIAGIAYSGEGRAQAGMGADWGDVNGDGELDLVVTNFQDDYNTLYINRGGGAFSDATADVGLRAPALGYLAFGVDLADLDNDADLDLVVANGHIFDAMSYYNPAVLYSQSNQVFVNDGGGKLTELAAEQLGPLARRAVSRGMATGDIDNDGDLDVLVANNADEATLAVNALRSRPTPATTAATASSSTPVQPAADDAPTGRDRSPTAPGAGARFLMIRLVGAESSRDAIGARVTARAEQTTVHTQRSGASSFASQNDGRVHLGLGVADTVVVTIHWPSGIVDRLDGVSADGLIVVREGRGIVAREVW